MSYTSTQLERDWYNLGKLTDKYNLDRIIEKSKPEPNEIKQVIIRKIKKAVQEDDKEFEIPIAESRIWEGKVKSTQN